MPAVIPVIAGIVAAASGAAGIAEVGLSLANKPSAPKPPAGPTAAETAATADKAKQTETASLQSALPGINSATSGSLSPEAVLRLAELIKGEAGTPGVGASEEDILKLLTGSSNPLPFMVTAGNNPTGTTPSGLAPGGGG